MEHPTFRRASNGTLLLRASTEAQALGPRQPAGGQASYRAKKPEEVDAEAWAHVVSEGGDPANAALVLSRWKVQFGRYRGKTFHWLLENDVGYCVNLVASHQKEREREGSQSPLMANKDAFTRYSSPYPDFVEAVRFHRVFEEARVRSLQPGQEGQALVGFGDYKSKTLQSLYQSEDSRKIQFEYLLDCTIVPVLSHMKNYLIGTDLSTTSGGRRQLQARTWRKPYIMSKPETGRGRLLLYPPPPPWPPPRPAAAEAAPSLRPLSWPQKLLHSLRPLSLDGDLCLRWKCRQKSRRCCISSLLRPALPSTSWEESTDEELVKAVVDFEESSGVQAPLSLPPHPPPATSFQHLPPESQVPTAAHGAPAAAVGAPAAAVGAPAAALGAPAAALGAPAAALGAPAAVLGAPAAPAPPPAGSAELLPVSWRATLTAEQQEWIGRVLFSRDSMGRGTKVPILERRVSNDR